MKIAWLQKQGDINLLYWGCFFSLPDGKNCKTCDRVLSILETEHEDLVDAGVHVVKMNDKKTAKQAGVLTFPGLTFFKAGIGTNYEGERRVAECTLIKGLVHGCEPQL